MICALLISLALLAPADAAESWPDIDTPLRTEAKAPNDAAVVIGNETYTNIADVPYAGADADAFRAFLLYTRGVPQSQVQVLDNASPREMERAVEDAAAEVGAGGTLWVFYAGHGAAHPETKERVLLGSYAKLDPDPKIFEEGVVELAALKRAAASQGQVVFIVDACYSGTGRGGAELGGGRFAVPPVYGGDANVIEWTATQPDEIASPLDAAGHGAFTYFAVGALRGWADGELGEKDGSVSLAEAQTYVSTSLRAVGQRNQTPAVVGDDAVALVASDQLESAPDLRSLGASEGDPGDGGQENGGSSTEAPPQEEKPEGAMERILTHKSSAGSESLTDACPDQASYPVQGFRVERAEMGGKNDKSITEARSLARRRLMEEICLGVSSVRCGVYSRNIMPIASGYYDEELKIACASVAISEETLYALE